MPKARAEVASATLFFNSGSSTTIICHGCALHAEGAKRAASTMRSIFSFSTARSGSKARTLCRVETNSRKFIILLLIQCQQSADVFTNNVKLEVDHRARFNLMKIGVLVRVRYNGYFK